MLLGPVEGEQPALGAVGGVDGQDQPGGVEPVLGHPLGEVLGVHRALLGVGGEGGGVDPQHGLGVGVGVGADAHARPAGASGGSGSDVRRRITHSSRTRSKPVRSARRRAAGWSACDHASSAACGAHLVEELLEQLAAQAAAAGLGGHDEGELVVDEHRDGVAVDPGAEPVGVAQRHQRGLVERGGAVGGLRERGDPLDLAGVVQGVHSAQPSQGRSLTPAARWPRRGRRPRRGRPWPAPRSGSRRCARCR